MHHEQVLEGLEKINKERASLGLRPVTAREYNSLFDWKKGGDYARVENRLMQLTAKEASAMTKAATLDTAADVSRSIASRVKKPAVAFGIGLEALRRRKNEMAALEAAKAASVSGGAARYAPHFLRAAGTYAPLLGMTDVTDRVSDSIQSKQFKNPSYSPTFMTDVAPQLGISLANALTMGAVDAISGNEKMSMYPTADNYLAFFMNKPSTGSAVLDAVAGNKAWLDVARQDAQRRAEQEVYVPTL